MKPDDQKPYSGQLMEQLDGMVDQAFERARFVVPRGSRIVKFGEATWCRASSHQKAKAIAEALNHKKGRK